MTSGKVGAGHTIVRANLWAGVFLVVAGLSAILWLIPAFVTGADAESLDITPGFMPRVAAVSMCLLGVVIAASALWDLAHGAIEGDSREDSEENERLVFGRSEIVNTIVLAALSVAYVVLLQAIGFIPSSAIILFLLIFVSGYRNIPASAAIAILIPVGLEQLLWRTLSIRLPELFY